MKVYRGWIHGDKGDENILQGIGVKLGAWDDQAKAWSPCDVAPEILPRLNRWRDRFMWGLNLVEVTP